MSGLFVFTVGCVLMGILAFWAVVSDYERRLKDKDEVQSCKQKELEELSKAWRIAVEGENSQRNRAILAEEALAKEVETSRSLRRLLAASEDDREAMRRAKLLIAQLHAIVGDKK